jgi:hypothetical protein
MTASPARQEEGFVNSVDVSSAPHDKERLMASMRAIVYDTLSLNAESLS